MCDERGAKTFARTPRRVKITAQNTPPVGQACLACWRARLAILCFAKLALPNWRSSLRRPSEPLPILPQHLLSRLIKLTGQLAESTLQRFASGHSPPSCHRLPCQLAALSFASAEKKNALPEKGLPCQLTRLALPAFSRWGGRAGRAEPRSG